MSGRLPAVFDQNPDHDLLRSDLAMFQFSGEVVGKESKTAGPCGAVYIKHQPVVVMHGSQAVTVKRGGEQIPDLLQESRLPLRAGKKCGKRTVRL